MARIEAEDREAQERLGALRAAIARRAGPAAISAANERATLRTGIAEIDGHLPGGGLNAGALHEVAGTANDLAGGAAAALFVAALLARRPGPVLWVLPRRDLFAPALAGVGLDPDRVIYAETGSAGALLATLEEGLREPGLAGAVAELPGRLDLTPSRRLQLAAEASGVPGFALRRVVIPARAGLDAPNAAETRWRITLEPAAPALPQAPATPGVGRPRWRLDLIRCRGGAAASWTIEAPDATGHCRLAAELADRPAQAADGRQPRRLAAG